MIILLEYRYQSEYFTKEELDGYSSPIVFLKSVEDDKINSECIYTMHLPDILWREVYGWLNENTLLLRDFDKTFMFNIETGEMIETNNYLGTSIYISDDKTAGCSARDEDWFGVSFTPILFWDTFDYKIS